MIYNELYHKVENQLINYLNKLKGIPEPLYSAMLYSVIGKGKRLRPIFTLIGANFGKHNEEDIMKIAIAIELIHCYSLIHDDLPAMDNDTLRRGKPTVHIKYTEAIAILAGDALLNQAFEILSELSIINIDYGKAVNYIVKKSGSRGMIAGQCIDISNDKQMTSEDIIKMYTLKTSNLFMAALAGGAIAAGVNKDIISKLENYARYIGIAFQITDDILETESEELVIGKNINSDTNVNKSTLLMKLNKKEANIIKNNYENKALNIARELKSEDLLEILDLLHNRKK